MIKLFSIMMVFFSFKNMPKEIVIVTSIIPSENDIIEKFKASINNPNDLSSIRVNMDIINNSNGKDGDYMVYVYYEIKDEVYSGKVIVRLKNKKNTVNFKMALSVVASVATIILYIKKQKNID